MTRTVTHRALTMAVLMSLLLASVRLGLSDDRAKSSPPHGPLDGMHFVGDFGPEGEPADLTDVLYFAEGQFWSENCVPCGFSPGVYWVRFSEDGIHFRGELESAERGRFLYSGVVRDGRLTAHINWRKDRWYWSIDRNFWFKGALAETVAAVSAKTAVGQAVAADSIDCEPGN